MRLDLVFSLRDIYMNSNLNPLIYSDKLCDEIGHPVDNLMESQRKLRQHDQNFPMGGKAIVEQILVSEVIIWFTCF